MHYSVSFVAVKEQSSKGRSEAKSNVPEARATSIATAKKGKSLPGHSQRHDTGVDKKLRRSDYGRFVRMPLEFVIQLAVVLFQGWRVVFGTWFQAIKNRIIMVEPLQALFLLVSFATTVAALFPWMEYHVVLISEERVTVGSNWKTVFALAGVSGVLTMLSDLPYRRRIFFVFQGLAAVLYLMGWIFPHPIHTSMTLESDYRLLPAIYVYGALLALHTMLGGVALKRPLFRVKGYLTQKG